MSSCARRLVLSAMTFANPTCASASRKAIRLPVTQPHAVLAEVPSVVLRTSRGHRNVAFEPRQSECPIFLHEQDIDRATDGFSLLVAEERFGCAPSPGDDPVDIEHHECNVRGLLPEQGERLLGREAWRRRAGLQLHGRRGGRARHVRSFGGPGRGVATRECFVPRERETPQPRAVPRKR